MIFGSHDHPGGPVGAEYLPTKSGTRLYRSQRYGCTGVVYERPLGNCAHFHRGIDIARSDGGCGTDILAAQKGTVHFAGKLPGGSPSYGAIVVEINHGSGWFTAYTHLQQEIVQQGQAVANGQKIGDMGKTGNATGCHLHLALKVGASATGGSILGDSNGTWRDPEPLIWQNVRVRPKNADSIRLRTALALTDATIYAETQADGHIHRKADNADLGLTSSWRKWDGVVTGPSYSAGGTSDKWERIWLSDRWLYIASLLSQRSAS
jgi:murein DD-endopeptidase MepM/ murein hydrolase activator NlpD